MAEKLITKTSKAYLLLSIVILVTLAPIFYFVTKKIYIDDADEALILRKKEFLKYSINSLKKEDIVKWNSFSRDVKILEFNGVSKDSIFYVTYFDKLDNEHEPYRELNYPIEIENEKYTFSARANLVETEDLIQSIAILFSTIILLFLLGVYFISRKLSRQLWMPFYNTLNQIESFEIDKNKIPVFKNSNTEEFLRLNNSLKKLISKNIEIYKNQREFIENAAHELQTPLAIFQAKIDSIFQLPNITEDHHELLNSLNSNVSRLRRLNKNLLLLSKIENESYTEKETVNLKELFTKNKVFFEEQAESKNLKLEIDSKSDIVLNTNAVLAEVMLSNLILNAIKHNKVDGIIKLELKSKNFTISNSSDGTSLNSNKLYERFSKHNPSKQGTGLGLAIVKKIVDLNNWEINYIFRNGLHCFTIHFE